MSTYNWRNGRSVSRPASGRAGGLSAGASGRRAANLIRRKERALQAAQARARLPRRQEADSLAHSRSSLLSGGRPLARSLSLSLSQLARNFFSLSFLFVYFLSRSPSCCLLSPPSLLRRPTESGQTESTITGAAAAPRSSLPMCAAGAPLCAPPVRVCGEQAQTRSHWAPVRENALRLSTGPGPRSRARPTCCGLDLGPLLLLWFW